jgi:hypothetical protein
VTENKKRGKHNQNCCHTLFQRGGQVAEVPAWPGGCSIPLCCSQQATTPALDWVARRGCSSLSVEKNGRRPQSWPRAVMKLWRLSHLSDYKLARAFHTLPADGLQETKLSQQQIPQVCFCLNSLNFLNILRTSPRLGERLLFTSWCTWAMTDIFCSILEAHQSKSFFFFSAGLFVEGQATRSSDLSTIDRTVGPSCLPTSLPDITCFDLPTPSLQYCSRDEPSPRDQLPLRHLCPSHGIHSSPPFGPGICPICRLGGHQWVLAGCQGKIPVPASTASIESSFPGNVQVLLPHLPSTNTSRCQTAGLQDVWRQLPAVGHVSAPRLFEACPPFWAVFSKWHRQARPQCLQPWRRWRRPSAAPSSEWDRFFRTCLKKM